MDEKKNPSNNLMSIIEQGIRQLGGRIEEQNKVIKAVTDYKAAVDRYSAAERASRDHDAAGVALADEWREASAAQARAARHLLDTIAG